MSSATRFLAVSCLFVVPAMLTGGVAHAQQHFGDTVVYDRAPTVDELNALFAAKPAAPRKVRKIELGPEPAAAQPATPVSTGGRVPQPAAQAKKVAFPIEFELNSAELVPSQQPKLASLGTFLAQNADMRVFIAGHADATGNDRTNLLLSQQRAATVMTVLAREYGIDTARMMAEGYGSSKPLQGLVGTHPLNRRVEFELVR